MPLVRASAFASLLVVCCSHQPARPVTAPASSPPAVSCEAIEWRDGPALAPWSEHSIDASCVHVGHFHAAPITDCRATLSAADSSALTSAIDDPEVKAALARAPGAHGEIILGNDGRAADLQFRAVAVRGKLVVLGSQCSGEPGCVDVTPGVTRLMNQLFALSCP